MHRVEKFGNPGASGLIRQRREQTSDRQAKANKGQSDAGSSMTGSTLRPRTPPAALISSIAINTTSLIGASLMAMRMRGTRPWVFTNLRAGTGLEVVVAWVQTQVEARLCKV